MISIIIPTYNRALVIKKSIMSVLNQTISDIELIIVDDGSTDNTKEIVESINDGRVKYIYQTNRGACAARNNGLMLAKGEYVAFHDSDDEWKANKLEKQLNAIKNNNVDIVVCKLNQYKNGKIVKVVPNRIGEGIISPVIDLFGIGTQTIFGKREVLQSMLFDEQFPRYQDLEYLYSLSKEYSIYCIDEGLVDYYIGEDSISKNPHKLIKAINLFLDKHQELIKDYPVMALHMKKNLLSEVEKSNRNSEDYKQAIERIKIDFVGIIKSLLFYIRKK